MTTFDLPEVRGFVADLDARMARCQNNDGRECSTLDAALTYHAKICREFIEGVRRWGRAVFAGRVALDPEVEAVWLTEGWRLYGRATGMYAIGQESEESCYVLEGRHVLSTALWGLYRLLKGWVTPGLAVGPSARRGLALDAQAAEEALRRLEALPPLPADWQPDDPTQRALYWCLRRS